MQPKPAARPEHPSTARFNAASANAASIRQPEDHGRRVHHHRQAHAEQSWSAAATIAVRRIITRFPIDNTAHRCAKSAATVHHPTARAVAVPRSVSATVDASLRGGGMLYADKSPYNLFFLSLFCLFSNLTEFVVFSNLKIMFCSLFVIFFVFEFNSGARAYYIYICYWN